MDTYGVIWKYTVFSFIFTVHDFRLVCISSLICFKISQTWQNKKKWFFFKCKWACLPLMAKQISKLNASFCVKLIFKCYSEAFNSNSIDSAAEHLPAALNGKSTYKRHVWLTFLKSFKGKLLRHPVKTSTMWYPVTTAAVHLTTNNTRQWHLL